jgi:hypothetical protein
MAGGIGGFLSGIFGSENENTAEKPAVDANAYNYGGYEGGATDAAMRYRENARNAQQRQAAQADYGATNKSTALGLQARGDMNTVGQAQLARALGKVPSIAQMQADRQMGQAAAEQASAAASARGAAGLALAGQQAANNTANAQANISGQAQINAAQERAQAEAAAAGTFGNLQQLDLGRSGLQANMAQYQATNQMQQRELNDRMTMDQLKNEMGVQGMQLGASQNLQAQRSANSLGAAGINAGVGGQNAAMNQSNAYGAIGLVSQGFGAMTQPSGSVTGKAAGGPVDGGKTYVMGEYGPEAVLGTAGGAGASLRDQNSFHPSQLEAIDLDEPQVQVVGQNGPEIVVPQKDGVVLPSHVTVPMLAQSTWGTGSGDREAQEMAAQDAETSTARGQQLQDTAARTVSPWEKQVRDTSVLQRRGLASDEDMDSAKRSRQVLRDARGSKAVPADEDKGSPEERAAVAEGKALPKQGKLSRVLGGISKGADKMAGAVDTAYHGPTSFAGPQLIPVAGARAGGGPVAGGMGYLMGERGPEMVIPTAGAAAPSFAPMQGGGMNPMSELKAHSAFATKFQRDPTGGMIAGAREDGGPVKRGLSYVMGEKGPEMVIDLDEGSDRAAMRDGSSDPRTNSFDKTFRRDTPADQKRVKRAVEDKAGRDADAMMASFGKSLAMGPSVAVRKQDGETTRIAARADGGEVEGGQPVLVGERGPEAVLTPRQQEIRQAAIADMSRRIHEDDAPVQTVGRAAATEQARPSRESPVAREVAKSMPADQAKNPVLTAAQQTVTPTLMPLSAFLSRMFGGR